MGAEFRHANSSALRSSDVRYAGTIPTRVNPLPQNQYSERLSLAGRNDDQEDLGRGWRGIKIPPLSFWQNEPNWRKIPQFQRGAAGYSRHRRHRPLLHTAFAVSPFWQNGKTAKQS
jgi:hypothetical protein